MFWNCACSKPQPNVLQWPRRFQSHLPLKFHDLKAYVPKVIKSTFETYPNIWKNGSFHLQFPEVTERFCSQQTDCSQSCTFWKVTHSAARFGTWHPYPIHRRSPKSALWQRWEYMQPGIYDSSQWIHWWLPKQLCNTNLDMEIRLILPFSDHNLFKKEMLQEKEMQLPWVHQTCARCFFVFLCMWFLKSHLEHFCHEGGDASWRYCFQAQW